MLRPLRLFAEQARSSLFFVPAAYVAAAITLAESLGSLDERLFAGGLEGEESIAGVPHLSVNLGVVLAVFAILAIVAFLDHSARSLQVGEIIHRVTGETRQRISEIFPAAAGTAKPSPVHEAPLPDGPGHVVRSNESGWIRQVDIDACLAAAPRGSVTALAIRNGSFVAAGQPICTIWPAPHDADATDAAIRDAVTLGATRMMLEDTALGIRQLVDIALRALSPGVNDPSTAYEAIVHLGDVMRDLLWRDLAPLVRVSDGRRLVAAADLTHEDYVDRAFDQIRSSAASHPAMVAALLMGVRRLAARHGLM